MKHRFNLSILTWLLASTFSYTCAASSTLPDIDIPQDEASKKRGAVVYYNLCRMCHSMKYIRYQTLGDIGFSKTEIDKLRGARHVNESLSSTSSSNSLRELFGMNPPDLSVMAKARRNGPQYIYALLSSYYERSEGHYDNQVFPGIKMPDVFAYSLAIDTLEKEKIQNRIKDVSAFLLWASDPKAEERRAMGKYVLGYLIILSLMFYVLMKRVWKRLD